MITIAQWLFWLSAAVLAYAYFFYPAILFLISQLVRKRNFPQDAALPKLSVLIAAYNEEADIGTKIEQTLKLNYEPEKLEIIVVSDGSTDGTDEIVRAISDPRVRLLRVEGRRGKTNAQNEGVKQCTGDIIVFSDATTAYHADALRYLASAYVDPEVGAVSGRYTYFDTTGNSPTGLGSIAFWSYENFIKKMQSDIYSLTGCSGCIYSLRRALYTPLPDSMLSDVVEPLTVLAKGHRIRFEHRALAFEETTKSSSQEFRMRVRIVGRGMRALFAMSELLKFWRHGWISFQLISHKLLRWYLWLFLMLLYVSSLILREIPFYWYVLLLQTAFYAMVPISTVLRLHKLWKPLGIPLYFCTLNAAGFLGVLSFLRGKHYVVWETER